MVPECVAEVSPRRGGCERDVQVARSVSWRAGCPHTASAIVPLLRPTLHPATAAHSHRALSSLLGRKLGLGKVRDCSAIGAPSSLGRHSLVGTCRGRGRSRACGSRGANGRRAACMQALQQRPMIRHLYDCAHGLGPRQPQLLDRLATHNAANSGLRRRHSRRRYPHSQTHTVRTRRGAAHADPFGAVRAPLSQQHVLMQHAQIPPSPPSERSRSPHRPASQPPQPRAWRAGTTRAAPAPPAQAAKNERASVLYVHELLAVMLRL